MERITFTKFLLITLIMALILSGCSINFNTGANSAGGGSSLDGGMYKSFDKGTSWLQKSSILGVGSKQSFASIDLVSLALDPEDNKAIYAGSLGNGLFYSYDGGESWQIARSLGGVTATNLAVDPNNKCVIYVTAANKVYKSVDCSRTWAVIYFDTDLKVAISSLAIDSGNSRNVYIGTSRGEIIQSLDAGSNWKTLYRFTGQVNKIIINPIDDKNMFVATPGGIFRSTDAGLSWASLADSLKSFNGGRAFHDFAIIKSTPPTLFLADSYGLIKSTDLGDTWSKIELIPPTPKTAALINAIAINPLDANQIYYNTNTTFYRSLDGGKTWNSMKLPTSRAGAKLLIDPKNPSIIYLETRLLKK